MPHAATAPPGITIPSPRALAVAAFLAAPLAASAVLRWLPGLDAPAVAPGAHFWLVSGACLLAMALCFVLVASARSLRETRVLFLALSFLTLAAIFSVHGLLTPGHLHDGVTAALVRSPWLSTLVAAIFAAASVLPLPGLSNRERVRMPWLIFGLVSSLSLGYIALSMVSPNWLAGFPTQDDWFQKTLATVTIGLFAVAAWHYWESYRFSRVTSQLAVPVGIVLLAEAQISLTFGQTWYYSWWIYHLLFLVAFSVILGGWMMEWRRSRDLGTIAEIVSTRGALKQLRRGQPQEIITLANEIESYHLDTSRHVDRVTGYAYAVGRQMNLRAPQLRELALGGQMHDVGKVLVPYRLLAKPGRLTEDEFTVIKQHTVLGEDLLREVPDLHHVATIVRHHHERFDGRGYPDGLAADATPLASRVISVVDAFDAMTAGRPYQHAVSVADAVAEIERCAGAQFDPDAVRAFLAALACGDLIPQVAGPAPALLDPPTIPRAA